jgi:hypothetical protein
MGVCFPLLESLEIDDRGQAQEEGGSGDSVLLWTVVSALHLRRLAMRGGTLHPHGSAALSAMTSACTGCTPLQAIESMMQLEQGLG